MNVSKAQRLLAQAAAERERLRRHLLVAAALREALVHEPIVVGGTAEEYYSAADYHETDLDLCGWLTREDEETLADLGFTEHGRHWVHEASKVAVEFPEPRIEGDEARIKRVRVRSGTAAIIGLEDLYLDRVRQATATDLSESIQLRSAVAVASASYDSMDWRYVQRQIDRTLKADPFLGRKMTRIDSNVRRAVRRALL